jgi:hypothetical protein
VEEPLLTPGDTIHSAVCRQKTLAFANDDFGPIADQFTIADFLLVQFASKRNIVHTDSVIDINHTGDE